MRCSVATIPGVEPISPGAGGGGKNNVGCIQYTCPDAPNNFGVCVILSRGWYMLPELFIETLTHCMRNLCKEMISGLGVPQFKFLFCVWHWEGEGDGKVIKREGGGG